MNCHVPYYLTYLLAALRFAGRRPGPFDAKGALRGKKPRARRGRLEARGAGYLLFGELADRRSKSYQTPRGGDRPLVLR